MKRYSVTVILAVAAGFACATLHADAPDEEGVTMYRDDGFDDKKFHVPVGTDCVHLDKEGDPLVKKYGQFEDAVSSIKWNIPKGNCLVLYNDDNYKEPRLILFGKGDIANLDDDYGAVDDSTSSVKWLPYPPSPHEGVPVAGRKN